jgi:hypothetical protein
MTTALQHRLETSARSLDSGTVSLRELVELQGSSHQGSLLILLSAPCALPIPGVGNVLGTAMVLVALSLWRGNTALELPDRIADWRMSARSGRRVLMLLSRIYGLAGRWSRQRLTHLTHVRKGTWLAPKIALMGVVIFLPIPFGNVLPALAITVLGVGLSLRDGAAVVGAALLAIASTAYTLALAAGAWTWVIEPLMT